MNLAQHYYSERMNASANDGRTFGEIVAEYLDGGGGGGRTSYNDRLAQLDARLQNGDFVRGRQFDRGTTQALRVLQRLGNTASHPGGIKPSDKPRFIHAMFAVAKQIAPPLAPMPEARRVGGVMIQGALSRYLDTLFISATQCAEIVEAGYARLEDLQGVTAAELVEDGVRRPVAKKLVAGLGAAQAAEAARVEQARRRAAAQQAENKRREREREEQARRRAEEARQQAVAQQAENDRREREREEQAKRLAEEARRDSERAESLRQKARQEAPLGTIFVVTGCEKPELNGYYRYENEGTYINDDGGTVHRGGYTFQIGYEYKCEYKCESDERLSRPQESGWRAERKDRITGEEVQCDVRVTYLYSNEREQKEGEQRERERRQRDAEKQAAIEREEQARRQAEEARQRDAAQQAEIGRQEREREAQQAEIEAEIERLRPEAPSGAVLLVTGSSNAKINGYYRVTGKYSNRPEYKNVNGDEKIFYEGDSWNAAETHFSAQVRTISPIMALFTLPVIVPVFLLASNHDYHKDDKTAVRPPESGWKHFLKNENNLRLTYLYDGETGPSGAVFVVTGCEGPGVNGYYCDINELWNGKPKYINEKGETIYYFNNWGGVNYWVFPGRKSIRCPDPRGNAPRPPESGWLKDSGESPSGTRLLYCAP